MALFGHSRSVGLGLLSTGVVCPCHVLVGLAGLLTGGQLLTPAAQDGLHAVYLPFAVLAGAMLVREQPSSTSGEGWGEGGLRGRASLLLRQRHLTRGTRGFALRRRAD
jgi:hypothetical protein